MSGDERAIRIKLEVSIPAGGAMPVIQASTAAVSGAAPPPQGIGQGLAKAGGAVAEFALASINNCGAECILPGSPPRARVFAVGSAPRDELCDFPRRAFGVVTPGAAEAPGDSPPPYTPSVGVNSSDGTYAFEHATGLQAAFCDPSGATYTVTVWYEYRTSDNAFHHFSKATCSFVIDCSTLQPCPQNPPSGAGALTGITESLRTLAYRFAVVTQGFAGAEVAPFNGAWQLTLARREGEEFIYETPTAPSGARAVLVLRSTGAHRLEFRCGTTCVAYLMGCCGFHSSGDNLFGRVECTGIGPQNSVPAAILLRPA